MSERYEAGSPQWLAALHACIAGARRDAQFSQDFTLCEVYTNVPSSIPSDGGTVAFTATIHRDSTEVEFELREADTADFKLTVDYSHMLPAARLIVDGVPENQTELEKILFRAVRSGHATIEGSPSEELAKLGVHDRIARLTK